MVNGCGVERALPHAAWLSVVVLCARGVAQESRPSVYLNTPPDVQYIGDEPCRSCHPAEFANFRRTGMGRSMRLPSVAGELGQSASPVTLQGAGPGLSYRIFARLGKVFHSEKVVDAKGREIFSESHEVAYCVGSGNQGRSYLIRREDSLFVSPLSYYASENRWDLSPGHDTGLYRGFTRPAGELCVYCHSGLMPLVTGTFNRFRQPQLQALAIGCERCHGPGQLHVAQERYRAGRFPRPVDCESGEAG